MNELGQLYSDANGSLTKVSDLNFEKIVKVETIGNLKNESEVQMNNVSVLCCNYELNAFIGQKKTFGEIKSDILKDLERTIYSRLELKQCKSKLPKRSIIEINYVRISIYYFNNNEKAKLIEKIKSYFIFARSYKVINFEENVEEINNDNFIKNKNESDLIDPLQTRVMRENIVYTKNTGSHSKNKNSLKVVFVMFSLMILLIAFIVRKMI